MPFDGSGNFQRVHNWVADAAAEIKIKADRHDAEDDNLASGLSLVITRDGQSTITNPIPFNGQRITGLGTPIDAQDGATKAYVDTRTTFAPLVVTGSDVKGRISFSGTQAALAAGQPLGLSFLQANLFAGVKPQGVEAVERPARWVWNNLASGAGSDVMELTRTGQLAIGRPVPNGSRSSLTLNSDLSLQDIFLNAYFSTLSSEILTDLDGFASMLDYNRTLGTWKFLRSKATRFAGVAMAPYDTVFEIAEDGSIKGMGRLFAGEAFLTTTGDLSGSIWKAWMDDPDDEVSAFAAIGARIEERAQYWAKPDESITDTRMGTTEISWDRGGGVVVGEKWENDGYVITALEARPGDVTKYYARQPEVYTKAKGWHAAFKAPVTTP